MRLAIAIILATLAFHASAAVPRILDNFATTNSPSTLSNIVASIGGGDQVWTNDSGVIRPVEEVASTNILLYPTASDGSVPYIFGTSEAHTTGNLVELNNQGTNLAMISSWGGLMMGRYAEAGWGPLGDDDGLIIIRDPTGGDNQSLRVNFTSVSDVDDYSNYGEFALTVTTNGLELKMVAADGSGETGTSFNNSPGTAEITTKINNQIVTSSQPGTGDGNTPYIYDTFIAHTSGNLLEVANNTTNKFTVGWDGEVAAAGAIKATQNGVTGTLSSNRLDVAKINGIGGIGSTNLMTGRIMSTNDNVANTYLDINGGILAAGNVLEYKTNNVSKFSVTTDGSITVSSSLANLTMGGGISGANVTATTTVISPVFRSSSQANMTLGASGVTNIHVLSTNVNFSSQINVTNWIALPTNYIAANFIPEAGKVKIVSSNGALYSVTQISTNVISPP